MKRIECIIMDWAGTAVDYGCFAPVAAFVESFRAIGVPVTAAETRAHMGLTKVEEIRALFDIERVLRESPTPTWQLKRWKKRSLGAYTDLKPAIVGLRLFTCGRFSFLHALSQFYLHLICLFYLLGFYIKKGVMSLIFCLIHLPSYNKMGIIYAREKRKRV